MKVIKTNLESCLVIEPKTFSDERGFFREVYQEIRYTEMANIRLRFLQDNQSRSSYNVLRGLHFQIKKPQGKLVRVTKGEVFDVAVDIRRESPTYGKWFGINLSEENALQFWIPPGFAHGFQVLSKTADFEYKCTDYYDPDDEGIIKWDDPDIGISWPIKNPNLSEKDSKGIYLNELKV